jgi:hypothetical protein
MNAQGRVHIGIRGSQNGARSGTRRHAGHVHAFAVNGPILRNLTRNSGNDRRFSEIALLILSIKPIPALRLIGSDRLFRIGNKKRMSVAESIHSCAPGELIG